ncbi:MAG TPA: ABC transporter substrate-binding protein, partial [Prolixibacteraceae bacterium]|nr:ABC transporter substrate-binding protein [Prolixibacteraceae bacterium]
HIGFLDALGEVTSISGLSGSKYLTNKEVNRGVAEYRIREVGYEGGLNYEMILQLKPDVVFAYGVGSEINAQVNKLQDLGIPVVLVGEYLEQSPLAKAEWIRFFGAFFGKEKLAMDVFAQISTNYNTIKATVADERDKPAVLTGLPFKDTWWMAGGQSNLAMLINDAGGEFLWNENQSKEAFPVSLEEVFLRAAQADFWINCGSVRTMDELLAHDQRFSVLPAVMKSRVYNNNLRSTPDGGSDYWESGVVHPDLVLSDLVAIFHPQKAAGKDFYYYRKIVSE